MVAKIFGKFKTAKKPKDPKNGAAPSKTKPIKSKMKPSPNPKSESLATPTGTPRSTRATPNPAGSATNGKPGKPKPKITLHIIISIILGVIILLMTIAAVLYFVLKPSEEPANVCKTPQCISLAHQLLNWRDDKVDPCDNFYQYTCGKYAEQVNSKQSPMGWKQNLLVNSISNDLKKLKTPKRLSEMAMKKYLDYCEQGNYTLDGNSLGDMFKDVQKIGKWPMADPTFDASKFDVNEYLVNMARHFKIPYFGFFIINPGRIVAIMRDLLLKKNDFQDAEPFIRTILQHHGIDTTSLHDDLDEVATFVDSLAVSTVLITPDQLVPISVNDLRNKYPNIDFDRILSNFVTPKHWKLLKTRLHIEREFYDPSLLESLISIANAKKVANFLIIRSLLMIKIMVNPNPQNCAKSLLKGMARPTLSFMVRHYFNKQNLEAVSGIVEQMKSTYRKTFESSTWLQESTKKNALKKLEKMGKIVGYSEELMDPEKFEQRFAKESMLQNTDSIYLFCIKISRFDVNLDIEEVVSGQGMVTNGDFTITNAFYLSEMITVSIMDDPLFDASYPKYAQIGSIGYVVGHEIGHGFDPDGAKYDENGKLRDWWTSKDKTEFEKRSQCVINKYENYDDPKFGRNQLNGTLTVGENVADLLGSRISWDIYKNVDVSKEQKLAGFQDYNIDKLFFQILALNWCAPHNTLTLAQQLTNPHGVDNYRVNGVFSNMKQFAETFDCPVGSKMNPATKCEMF